MSLAGNGRACNEVICGTNQYVYNNACVTCPANRRTLRVTVLPRRATRVVHVLATAIGEAVRRTRARNHVMLVIIEPAKAVRLPTPRVAPGAE